MRKRHTSNTRKSFRKFVKLFFIIVGVTTETLVGCKTFLKSLSLCQVSDQPSVDCIAYSFYVLLRTVDHNFVIIFGKNGRMTGVIWPVESEFDGTLFWLTLFLPRRPSQTISQTNGEKKGQGRIGFSTEFVVLDVTFIVNESIYSTPTIQAGEPRGEVTARHFPIVEGGGGNH